MKRVVLDRLLQRYEIRGSKDFERFSHKLLESLKSRHLNLASTGARARNRVLGIPQPAINVFEQRPEQRVPRTRKMLLEAAIRSNVDQWNRIAHVARYANDWLVLVLLALPGRFADNHDRPALAVDAILLKTAFALSWADLVARPFERHSKHVGGRSSLHLVKGNGGIEFQGDLDVSRGLA